jgi:methylated-DNA-[protein]-cysteine S-methyltransferase
METSMNTTIIQTVLGPARLAASDGALVGLWFRGQQHEPLIPADTVTSDLDSDPALRVAADWLAGYLLGRSGASLPRLAPRGTAFQRAVWSALLQIPRGQTTTYGALASGLGKPSATRAVAAAVGRNPISVLIPCHRVIGSNGSLTGYAGGLGRKQILLTLEQGQDREWQRSTKAYRAQYADPIEVEVGDTVHWLDREDDGEYPGWKWAVANDGRAGWVPRSYFGPGEQQAVARRRYSAVELSVSAGDLFLELDSYSGWAWVVNQAGHCGWLPHSALS